MNAYADLATFKSKLSIEKFEDDAELLRLLESASRRIEGICNRSFYVETATVYVNGNGASRLYLPRPYELLTVTSVLVDDDEDYDYDIAPVENTDYWLWPDNTTYKWAIDLRPTSTVLTSWPAYRRAVKIAGLWGYENDTYDSGTNVATGGISSSATSLPVDSPTAFSVGHTLLVESEQMYVTAVGTALTVERAVNGTTAAAHVATKDIYIYRYPDQVKDACLFAAHAMKEQEESPITQVIASPEMGTLTVPRSVDRQLEAILQGIIRPPECI